MAPVTRSPKNAPAIEPVGHGMRDTVSKRDAMRAKGSVRSSRAKRARAMVAAGTRSAPKAVCSSRKARSSSAMSVSAMAMRRASFAMICPAACSACAKRTE